MKHGHMLLKDLRSNPVKTKVIFMVFLFLIVTLTGCGSSKSSFDNIQGEVRSQSHSNNESASPQDLDSIAPSAEVSFDRKIIQNADLRLRVQDVAATLDRVSELGNQKGGYIVNSHINRDADRVSADISLKVPQSALNSTIETISQYGEITDQIISTQDVTEEYYDSEARLKVLKAKEERLLGLMDKAANITEIISIENELAKTRSEIEVLAGRLQYLTNAVDYSLISIRLEQGVPGAIKAPQGTFGKAVQGLIGSLNSLINFAGDTVVFLFVILPWAVVLAILFGLGRYLYKRRPPRSPKE